MKDYKEERKGMRTKNTGKWKRRIRQSQWEKEIISDGNKENWGQNGNKKGL